VERVKDAENKFNEHLKAIYFTNLSVIQKIQRANNLGTPEEPEEVGLKNLYFLRLRKV